MYDGRNTLGKLSDHVTISGDWNASVLCGVLLKLKNVGNLMGTVFYVLESLFLIQRKEVVHEMRGL